MREMKFDLVVVGGGPGGYTSVIRAAQLGLKTALVEREHLSGSCFNWGCILTKALLHSASMYRQMQHASRLGIKVHGLSFDFKQLVQRSRGIADRMSNGVRHLLKKNKVSPYEGHGSLLPPHRVEITQPDGGKAVIGAPHIIRATGARPRELPNLAVDGERIHFASADFPSSATARQLRSMKLMVSLKRYSMPSPENCLVRIWWVPRSPN